MKVFRRLLTLATLTLFVIAAGVRVSQAQETVGADSAKAVSDWQTYTVKDEEFSVALPGVPAMTTQTVHLLKLNRDRKQRTLGAYADGVVFAIFTFENPNQRQSIDEIIAEGYGNSEDQPLRHLMLAGFRGEEYGSRRDDRRWVVQFYLTDRHIYMFEAVGSSFGNPDEAIPKFFSSIKLGKNPHGVEVKNGPGEQPVSDSPIVASNQPFSPKAVTRKAGVVTKPEPAYTESARQNRVTGTVVLRCVFSSSGLVTNIRAVSGLPFGLTERAIESARQIKFIPAVKEGHFVSMYIQLEYNFNLY